MTLIDEGERSRPSFIFLIAIFDKQLNDGRTKIRRPKGMEM